MFYSLKNLVVLGLSQNEIEELPDEICQLSNLEELYLQGNAISVYDQHTLNDGFYMQLCLPLTEFLKVFIS